MEAEGVERLVLLTQNKRRYSPRVVKFASQVLYSMWQHQVCPKLNFNEDGDLRLYVLVFS